jgi:hypothetical protein
LGAVASAKAASKATNNQPMTMMGINIAQASF